MKNQSQTPNAEKIHCMVILTRELDQRLDDAAKRSGESRSTIVRMALASYVKQAEQEAA